MTEEVLEKRGTVLVRRQRLAPGESTPWHLDPHHRVTVVLSGEALAIEYPDGTVVQQFSVTPGQVDWDEPFDRVHRCTTSETCPMKRWRCSSSTRRTPIRSLARMVR